MSLKIKLISCVIAFCLIVSLLAVGVFALKTTSFNVGGSISFEANGAKATVSKVSLTDGAFDSSLNDGRSDFFETFTIDTTMYQEDVDKAAESWQGVKLQFPSDGSDVELIFKVTNNNTKEQLTVWPECTTDTSNSNVKVMITGKGLANNVLAASGTSNKDFENYTITFSLKDKKISIKNFEFKIKVDLKTASELPLSSTYDKLSFSVIGSSAPNCLSVSQASSDVGGNIVFPDFVLYDLLAYKVTTIANSAFSNNTNITGVTFSKTITSIRYEAFDGCSELTGYLNFRNVISIETSAFEDCSKLTGLINLQNITRIYDCAFRHCSGLTGELDLQNVTSIGDDAFVGCKNITGVNIKNVTKIYQYAFSNCGLTSVVIPTVLEASNIGASVFNNCLNLATVIIDSVSVAEALTERTSCGNLLGSSALKTVKVKAEGLNSYTDVGSYLKSNFSCDGSIDSDGYYVFTRA